MILLWQYPNKPYCRCKALWEDRWFLLSHSLESEGVIKHEEKRGGICVLFSHTSSPSRKSYLPPSSFKLICCWLFLKSSKSPSVKPWPLPLYSTLLSSIIQLTISIPPTSFVFYLLSPNLGLYLFTFSSLWKTVSRVKIVKSNPDSSTFVIFLHYSPQRTTQIQKKKIFYLTPVIYTFSNHKSRVEDNMIYDDVMWSLSILNATSTHKCARTQTNHRYKKLRNCY